MFRIKTILLLGITFTIISCNTEIKKENTLVKTEKEVVKDIVKAPEKVEKTINLSLNDGNKWKVNQEMIPFIISGKQMVTFFLNENKNDFQKLATDLAHQNQKLISSCTMNGKSHDELHKWLMPHIGLVSKLKKSENNEDAQIIIQKLDSSYAKYDTFFE